LSSGGALLEGATEGAGKGIAALAGAELSISDPAIFSVALTSGFDRGPGSETAFSFMVDCGGVYVVEL
jgi:hypothetical protein